MTPVGQSFARCHAALKRAALLCLGLMAAALVVASPGRAHAAAWTAGVLDGWSAGRPSVSAPKLIVAPVALRERDAGDAASMRRNGESVAYAIEAESRTRVASTVRRRQGSSSAVLRQGPLQRMDGGSGTVFTGHGIPALGSHRAPPVEYRIIDGRAAKLLERMRPSSETRAANAPRGPPAGCSARI